MKDRITITESELKSMIKEGIKKVLKEIRGWSAEPDDFILVDGQIDPNKNYQLIKICPNIIALMYVVEDRGDLGENVNAIREYDNDENIFIPMEKFNELIDEYAREENVDEEEAEARISETYIPFWDYDFALYTPYGFHTSEVMSGVEMQKNIDATGNRW